MALPQTAFKSQPVPRVESKTASGQTTGEIKPDMDRCEEQAASFDCAALLAMLQDPYAADESNRAFFHVRFCLSEDPLQPYKMTIDRSLWPDIFRGQRASVSKAKRAITDYKNAVGNRESLAELMVFYCERTAGFCADVYHTDPAYFDAWCECSRRAQNHGRTTTNSDQPSQQARSGAEYCSSAAMALVKTWTFCLLSSIRPFSQRGASWK